MMIQDYVFLPFLYRSIQHGVSVHPLTFLPALSSMPGFTPGGGKLASVCQ